jgi:hydrogenase maturation protease
VRYLVGFGNYTSRDDSIGVRIVEHISERGLEQGFRALDLATNSLSLVSYLEPHTEAILIIDSARMNEAPGTVRFFAPSEVDTRKTQSGFSTHEGDVLKVLELAARLNYLIPRILIMGIEPASIEGGIGLSKALEDRFQEYVEAGIARVQTM